MRELIFFGKWMAPDVGETVTFLIDLGECRILVDTGMNVVGNISKNNINPQDIDNIIITHMHGDHISSFPNFLFYRYIYHPILFKHEATSFNLYIHNDNINDLKSFVKIPYKSVLEKSHFKECLISSDFQEFPLSNSYKITFVKVDHDVPTIGFRIDSLNDDFSLVYSSDTRPSNIVKNLSKNATYLIHDVIGTSKFEKIAKKGHTTASDLGELINNQNIKNIIPVHFLSIYKDNKTDEIKEELEQLFTGNIIMPIENKKIVL